MAITDLKVSTHADPEIVAAIKQLVKRGVEQDASLTTYIKSVNGQTCMVVVSIGGALSSLLLGCVDALREHVEKVIMEVSEKETKH